MQSAAFARIVVVDQTEVADQTVAAADCMADQSVVERIAVGQTVVVHIVVGLILVALRSNHQVDAAAVRYHM